jgi:hypothetical protein
MDRDGVNSITQSSVAPYGRQKFSLKYSEIFDDVSATHMNIGSSTRRIEPPQILLSRIGNVFGCPEFGLKTDFSLYVLQFYYKRV